MYGQENLTPELRKGLLEKNLAAFKKYNTPSTIYKILATHRPSSRLVFDDDGLPDVMVDDKLLFDGRADELAAEQLEAFRQHPTNIAFDPPDPGGLDRFGVPLLKNVLERAKADGIGFAHGVSSGSSFFLTVFGVGLGHHLDALIDATDPYIIIIVEPNLDNLHHSLQTYPWHILFERQAEKGGCVYITLDSHPEKVAMQIQTVIRHYCPPGLNGMPCFVYSDPENAKSITDELLKNVGMIMFGLGFLFDETLMLKNAYLNLSSGSENIFVRAKNPAIKTPVFVVSAGPSLDQDLDFIRDNADKAIVISTGTALRSLLVNGITPDFHIESENIHLYSTINQLVQDYDLSSICLVAPVDADSHGVQFFDDIVYFFRDGLSPYPLFCRSDENTIPGSGPLVINASFSFAIEIGAKDIYLFGADFGVRGEGLDHAKDNVRFTEGALVGYVQKYNFLVPANFEGQFYSSSNLILGLKHMSARILFCDHGRRFFNCSDGARIEGAAPVRASDIRLKENAARKLRDKKRLRRGHTVMNEKWFKECWDEERLRNEINAFADGALAFLGDPDAFRDIGYLARYMIHTQREPKNGEAPPLVSPRGDMAAAVAFIFRGSLDYILSALVCYLGFVDNPAKEPRFREIVAEEMSTAIEAMRLTVLTTIDNPTDIMPVKTDGEWKDEDFIQEAYPTWGETSRNAPCPCGSGKRYKHCHGKKN